MEIKLLEVTNSFTLKLFHKVPHIIYKSDPNWICPLETMVDSAFDPKQNSYLKEGEICRWIVVDAKNKPLGRIAAFWHKKKSYCFDQPTGGCGFFESIDNLTIASKLFDTAKEWLEKKGMKAMDGPINPGENYVNWGLLVDGFMPQGYGMPYNPSYYEKFFRSYGFDVYFQQFSYHIDYTKPFPERFWKIAEWIAHKPTYSFEHFTFKSKDKFIDDFVKIYDQAWSGHDNFVPMSRADVVDFVESSKDILDEEYIWYAYHEGNPIALFVMIPDINQVLAKIDGKLNLWSKLKLFYYMKNKTITRTRILVMGIVPNFQRSGVESALFWYQAQIMKKRPHITELELSWAGDFNPKIVKVYESVGGEHVKTHHTLRYLFDRNQPFKRALTMS